MLPNILSLGLLAAGAGVASALPTAAHNILPGKYIVRLKPDVESHLQAHTEWVSEIHSHNLARRGGDSVGIEKTYHFASFEGYAGSFDDETLEAIKANPDVSGR
jgi:oryzin